MKSDHPESRGRERVLILMRTMARVMTLAVVALLMAGLVSAIRDRLATDTRSDALIATLPIGDLTSPGQLMNPLGLLTAGLVLLATVPVLTVMLVTIAHGYGRRWREAAIAATVLALLAISAIRR